MLGNKKERKLLGTRNGIKVYSTLKTKTPLKSKTQLKLATPKQIKKNRTWRIITDERCVMLNFKCEWCGQKGTRDFDDFNRLEGHHIISRRYGDYSKSNCYVIHKIEHRFITDHSINVKEYPTKLAWENRTKT